MLIWQYKNFQELSNDQLYSIIQVRQDIFVLEQQCFYADLDDADQACIHFFATTAADPLKIVAYLRITPPGIKYPQVAMGRILTTQTTRGSGIGVDLVTRALAHISQVYPDQDIKISAQAYLQKFYRRFGFKSISEIYDEDGIDHIDMLLTRA
ncbi:MAG: GNAT family N-acetyltransferase [Oceanospirillaceae bacterium]|nr:GNAT family N-acetyltransferase [Oceanospirillaceae bacterium]